LAVLRVGSWGDQKAVTTAECSVGRWAVMTADLTAALTVVRTGVRLGELKADLSADGKACH